MKAFLFSLLGVVIFESILRPFFSVAGAGPDLGLIFTAYFALSRGAVEGLFFGFTSGLLVDVLHPSLLGWGMLLRLSLGFWMGGFKDNLFLESFYSRGIVAGLSVLVYELGYHLADTGFSVSGTLYLLGRYSLLAALYSMLLAFLLFYFSGKRKPKQPEFTL
ncbi:MAG: rod shape-determining protein MreD [candidate division Zixibacteria bacterium]|nr:rod shape-determining protein MreD [candidate division Zixibacteria bacterium]